MKAGNLCVTAFPPGHFPGSIGQNPIKPADTLGMLCRLSCIIPNAPKRKGKKKSTELTAQMRKYYTS
jgi:hypothetical protein